MFHSNQEFVITRELQENEIIPVLNFIEEISGYIPNAFQITNDNRLILGHIFAENVTGWTRFSPQYNVLTGAYLIISHFKSTPIIEKEGEGSYYRGVRIKVPKRTLAPEENGIIKPFYSLIEIEPFTTFYSK